MCARIGIWMHTCTAGWVHLWAGVQRKAGGRREEQKRSDPCATRPGAEAGELQNTAFPAAAAFLIKFTLPLSFSVSFVIWLYSTKISNCQVFCKDCHIQGHTLQAWSPHPAAIKTHASKDCLHYTTAERKTKGFERSPFFPTSFQNQVIETSSTQALANGPESAKVVFKQECHSLGECE